MKKGLKFFIGIGFFLLLTGCQSNKDQIENINKQIEEKNAMIQENRTKIEELEEKIQRLEEEVVKQKNQEMNKNSDDMEISSKEAEDIIHEEASEVITLLKEKNMDQLSQYIHPEKGVRFSPYTTVSLENDLVFKKEKIKGLLQDEKEYTWGYYDGSGKDIHLTPKDYYERFVYDQDYKNPEKIGYNEVLSNNNNLENQFEIYEGSIIVEFYFSGFDPAYKGMDWKSLRIVFEKYKNQWYVTGIIHNEWTI